nr:MAG TPA: hypothetical protein [Caudoviricetes sp.]
MIENCNRFFTCSPTEISRATRTREKIIMI